LRRLTGLLLALLFIFALAPVSALAQVSEWSEWRTERFAILYSSADEPLCATLDRCKDVSLFLLEHAPSWLDEH